MINLHIFAVNVKKWELVEREFVTMINTKVNAKNVVVQRYVHTIVSEINVKSVVVQRYVHIIVSEISVSSAKALVFVYMTKSDKCAYYAKVQLSACIKGTNDNVVFVMVMLYVIMTNKNHIVMYASHSCTSQIECDKWLVKL